MLEVHNNSNLDKWHDSFIFWWVCFPVIAETALS